MSYIVTAIFTAGSLLAYVSTEHFYWAIMCAFRVARHRTEVETGVDPELVTLPIRTVGLVGACPHT